MDCAVTGRTTGVATGNADLSGTGTSAATSAAACSCSAAPGTLARRHTRPTTTTWSFSDNGAIRHQVDGSPR